MGLLRLRFGWIVLATVVSALMVFAPGHAQERPKIEFVPDFAQNSAVIVVAFSPDGSRFVSGGTDKTLKLWDAGNGQLIRVFKGHTDDVDAIAFSPDGAYALSGGKDRTLRLWEISSGDTLRTVEAHTKEINSVAFSPDGTRLLSASDDETIKLWDATSGKLLRTFEGHEDEVNCAIFSRDGSKLLSGSEDHTLKLWDVATGQVLTTFAGHAGSVHSVAFSPDGKRLLSGSEDKSVKLWDAATGRVLFSLEGHSGPVTAVAFSPDGKRVLSASEDRAIKLWDASTGELLRTFEGHSDSVESVAFSRDGNHMLSGGSDGRVIDWSTSSASSHVSLFSDADGNWLAITPEGFFAASPNRDMPGSVRDIEPYTLAQFNDRLYRPDLVGEALKGDPAGKLKEASANTSLEKILESGPAPQIELDEKKVDKATGAAKLSLGIRDLGGGIGSKVVWRLNGKTVADTSAPGLQGPPNAGRTAYVTQTLSMDPTRSNIVEITAYNGADLLATPTCKIVIEPLDLAAKVH
jgi:WD40 repeat protein